MEDLLGWQNTRWGMVGDEIIAAVGSDVVKRSEREKYQGLYSDLCIPHVAIGPHYFKVIFQMKDETDRLFQVLLSYQDLGLSNPQIVFEVACRVLTERFGESGRFGTSDDRQWVESVRNSVCGA